MALRRRNGTGNEGNLWAGFVDVMSGLILIMIFILTIFMISQFFLRETILGQGRQLSSLEGQLTSLAEALGATQKENDALQGQVDDLADQNENLVETNTGLNNQLQSLQFEIDEQQGRIANFEERVAALVAKNLELDQRALALDQENQSLADENREIDATNAAQLAALAAQQNQLDSQEAEQAAINALLSDLTEGSDDDALASKIDDVEALAKLALQDSTLAESDLGAALKAELDNLTELERERASKAIAAEYLRERLQNSEDELTAMRLALEKERQTAEDTLTLLAAIDQERADITNSDLSDAEKQAALLEIARREIETRDQMSARDAEKLALLNRQTAQLRAQLNGLQGLLNAAAEADADADVQIDALGTSLNAALARVAAEERKRANSLEEFRSDFFGRLRQVLDDVDGVEIVGDRFVFNSEVLFPTGSAQLSPAGRAQIAKVAELVQQIGDEIPSDINWILRVDGHTDIQPVGDTSQYADNWELSQARALNVVRYMIDQSGVDPKRLAAAGFGEYHPIDTGTSPETLERNRRIELKLTEQ